MTPERRRRYQRLGLPGSHSSRRSLLGLIVPPTLFARADEERTRRRRVLWARPLAEIFALDQPDASEIEQMRAPTASRQPNRQLRSDQQKYRDHRQRHGADPVQPHRRQLLRALGIGSAAGYKTPALANKLAPCAASRRA